MRSSGADFFEALRRIGERVRYGELALRFSSGRLVAVRVTMDFSTRYPEEMADRAEEAGLEELKRLIEDNGGS